MKKETVWKWIVNLAAIVLILALVDGQLKYWGVGVVLLVNIILAGIRIYKQRQAISALLSMANQLGKIHKKEAEKKDEAQ